MALVNSVTHPFANATFLKKSGGTMTGALTLSDGSPAASEEHVADAVADAVDGVGFGVDPRGMAEYGAGSAAETKAAIEAAATLAMSLGQPVNFFGDKYDVGTNQVVLSITNNQALELRGQGGSPVGRIYGQKLDGPVILIEVDSSGRNGAITLDGISVHGNTTDDATTLSYTSAHRLVAIRGGESAMGNTFVRYCSLHGGYDDLELDTVRSAVITGNYFGGYARHACSSYRSNGGYDGGDSTFHANGCQSMAASDARFVAEGAMFGLYGGSMWRIYENKSWPWHKRTVRVYLFNTDAGDGLGTVGLHVHHNQIDSLYLDSDGTVSGDADSSIVEIDSAYGTGGAGSSVVGNFIQWVRVEGNHCDAVHWAVRVKCRPTALRHLTIRKNDGAQGSVWFDGANAGCSDLVVDSGNLDDATSGQTRYVLCSTPGNVTSYRVYEPDRNPSELTSDLDVTPRLPYTETHVNNPSSGVVTIGLPEAHEAHKRIEEGRITEDTSIVIPDTMPANVEIEYLVKHSGDGHDVTIGAAPTDWTHQHVGDAITAGVDNRCDRIYLSTRRTSGPTRNQLITRFEEGEVIAGLTTEIGVDGYALEETIEDSFDGTLGTALHGRIPDVLDVGTAWVASTTGGTQPILDGSGRFNFRANSYATLDGLVANCWTEVSFIYDAAITAGTWTGPDINFVDTSNRWQLVMNHTTGANSMTRIGGGGGTTVYAGTAVDPWVVGETYTVRIVAFDDRLIWFWGVGAAEPTEIGDHTITTRPHKTATKFRLNSPTNNAYTTVRYLNFKAGSLITE